MRRLRVAAAIVAILWLATALRFYRLDAQSFWNDEGNSARLSERSVPLIIEGTAGDIHPPLYYLMLHGWRGLLGESEFVLRALSTFAGVGVVAATFSLGQQIFVRHRTLASLAAALAAAVHPALVYYSQETRMYELLALWVVLSTLLLVRLRPLATGDVTRRAAVFRIVAYVLVVVAGLYTHYFFPAGLAVHALIVLTFLLVRRSHPHTRSPAHLLAAWAGMMLAALLLYLPWLPIFLRQAGTRPGDATPVFPFLQDATRFLAVGHTISPEAARWPLGAVGVLVATAVIGDWRLAIGGSSPNRQSLISNLLLLLGAAVPVLLMLVAGTTRDAYFKFMLISVPFLCLLAGRGLAIAWPSPLHPHTPTPPRVYLLRVAVLVVVAVALYGPGRALYNLYTNPAYARADYRGIAARIAAEGHPNAGIILDAPNQWEVFTYYHRDGAPVYPLPRGTPDPVRIDAALSEIATRHDRLYALFWGEAERDPERLVERWLDAHAFKAREEWVGDVRFVTYAVPEEPATALETPLDLAFGDHVRLLGYTLRGETLPAGDVIQLALFWQTDAPLDTRYKVFLHLVDGSGAIVAQRDGEPGGGLALTTTWEPDEVVVDNHGVLVPLQASPGRYTLRLGLYPLADPTDRLPLRHNGNLLDAFPIATITVTQ